MKSLHKIFDILEYVTLRNGEPVTPGEASSALSLNIATASRIMGELVKRGYLVKVSRKSGYIAGPMTVSLVTRDNPYKQIADASRLPVLRLSEKLGCQVNISVMHDSTRYMLYFNMPDTALSPWRHFDFTDHWNTATGRLLTAGCDDTEAKKICRRCGLKTFPSEEIAKIRRNGSVDFKADGLRIIGHWIKLPGYPVAAFGFGVPPERAEEAFRLSAATAEEITGKLTVGTCQAY